MEETFGNIEIIVLFIIFFQKFRLFSLSRSFSTLIEYGGIEVFIELGLREAFCGSVNCNIHAHLHRSNDLTYYLFITSCSVRSTKNYLFFKTRFIVCKRKYTKKITFR
jgi:hypothetical protein